MSSQMGARTGMFRPLCLQYIKFLCPLQPKRVYLKDFFVVMQISHLQPGSVRRGEKPETNKHMHLQSFPCY